MVQELLKRNKRMQRLFILLFITVLIHSCVFVRVDDSIDLGSKYRYIQETPQTIIYHNDSDYKGVGIEIVPPIVLSYKFDDRYIIAKSQEVDEITGSKEGRPIHYWIIDKTKEGTQVKPMDSITFYLQIKEHNINLVL